MAVYWPEYATIIVAIQLSVYEVQLIKIMHFVYNHPVDLRRRRVRVFN